MLISCKFISKNSHQKFFLLVAKIALVIEESGNDFLLAASFSGKILKGKKTNKYF